MGRVACQSSQYSKEQGPTQQGQLGRKHPLPLAGPWVRSIAPASINH